MSSIFINHIFSMEETNMYAIFWAYGSLQATTEDRYVYNEKMTSLLEVSSASLRKKHRLHEGSTV